MKNKHILTRTPHTKHDGGTMVIWACFSSMGPRQLAVIESTVNSTVYKYSTGKCDDVRPTAKVAEIGSCQTSMFPSTPATKQQNINHKPQRTEVMSETDSHTYNPVNLLQVVIKPIESQGVVGFSQSCETQLKL